LIIYSTIKGGERMEDKELTSMSASNTVDFASWGEMVTATRVVSSTTNSSYTKDSINNYLSNITSYAPYLRAVSDYFYSSNGIYKNVVDTFANLPTLDNIILPSATTMLKRADKSYQSYYDKVNSYADSINVKIATRNILKSVAKYGGYVAYERNEGSDFYFQQLPLDYCRIKYKLGNDYQLEFNFKYFDKFFNKEDIDFAWFVYPPEFKKLYNKYKSDRQSKTPEWQMLDIKKTICVIPNDDIPDFVPMFSGMFTSLLDNEEMKSLIQLGEKLDTIKLLVQKVPTDKDGNILMPKEAVQFFHSELKKIIPEGASGLTTPMDIKDVSFSNATQSKEELLAKAERGAWVNSGYSSAMFSDNGGHTGLQMNVEVVTSNIYAVLERIEDMFCRRFKTVANTKTYEFKLKFFRTTNVNVGDNFDRMFQLLTIGGALMPLFSLVGIDAETYITLLQVEQDLGVKDLLVVLQSMNTLSGNGSNPAQTDKGGNPVKQEKNLTDAGQKTRDNKSAGQ
jgi:hypothetical protein